MHCKACDNYREIFITTLAHLVVATDLLERGGKKAAASDKMFFQLIADFKKNIKQARIALKGEPNAL